MLTFVSGITTLVGLGFLYDVFGGHVSGSIGWLRYIIPIALAGSTHATIFWALKQWTTTRRPKYLLIALPLQICAVVASYGTHWTHMRGDSETVGAFESAQTALVRGIGSFVQSYRSLGDAATALAEHSEGQAKIEIDQGTSCGTHEKALPGPRWELRDADRDTYSRFKRVIDERRLKLEKLLERGEQATASSAAEAVDRRDELRRIVNDAKTEEASRFLARLKQSANERLQKGRGPIEIPIQKRKSGVTHFTCLDTKLEEHLTDVIEAIDGLKPVPEAGFKDARDPRVGFALALRRLGTVLTGARLMPLTQEELKRSREQGLTGKKIELEGLQPEDLAPMAVPIVVEALLTLLFWIGGGTLTVHPGMTALRALINGQREVEVLTEIWKALGGGDSTALRQAFNRYSKFEGNSTLVIVPLYAEDAALQALHHLMLLLVKVGLARPVYTGRHFARLFTVGWPKDRRSKPLAQAAVRIYRIGPVEYLSFILDFLLKRSTDDEP